VIVVGSATKKKKKSRAKLVKEAADKAKKALKTGKKPKEKKLTKKEQANLDAFMLPYKVKDDIEEQIKNGSIKIDHRGHYKGYHEGWFERSLSMMLLMLCDDKRAMEILTNRFQGKKDNRAVYLTHYSDTTCNSCCRDVKFKLTKTKIVADSECPHPDGYPAYSVRLNVPSGKIIFGNDFRDLIEIDASYDINRTKGCEQTSRAYADAGMIHIFVGNTCPGVYQISERRINLLSKEYIYSSDDDADESAPGAKEPKGECVGGICTDLWWYSAMDYDLFKKLAKKRHGKKWKDRISRWESIVKVEPGCYKAVGQSHIVRWDYEGDSKIKPEELFSYIKRDGDCRKLRPQSGYLQAAEFLRDFERAIEIRRMAWPTISQDRISILDHWFLTIGNGMEWNDGVLISVSGRAEDAIERYKNGERPDWTNERDDYHYERLAAEREGKEFVPPHGSHYPISDYSRCWKVPDNVEPDWLAGVREILHVVIEHGTGPKPPKGANERLVRDYKTNVRNIKEAKKCLKSLEKRFGEE
jgi:hypothetical protein